jgi:MSHA pilin protein MshA
MTKQQSGFTLIELVLVIVILGILAATALPRFSDLSSQARVAAVNGMAGALRSGAAIGHATQLARNIASSTAVTIEGQSITFANGYPDRPGITNMVVDSTGFSEAAGVWTLVTGCTITYTASGVNGAFPSVVVASGSC